MKGKILGIAIAFAMVAMAFSAFPAAAADPQAIWMTVNDHGGGATAEYYNTAGDEGWTIFWSGLESTKPIYRGDPAWSTTYMYAAPATYAAWTMDNLYADPAGWLYVSDYGGIAEDASGYGCAQIETTDGAATYFAATMDLAELPIATAVDADPNIDLTWPAFTGLYGAATVSTYNVYRSTSNVDWDDTGAGGPGFWALAGAAVTSPWSDVGIRTGSGNTYYYSIQPIVDGIEADVPFMYGSQPSNGILDAGVVNTPPTVDTASTVPAVHDGNTVTEYVTLTATGSDADLDPVTLEYSWDGGAWTPFVSPVDLNFPTPYTEGPHTVEVRAYDGQDYSLVNLNADFTITDTTAPVAGWNGVPGATAYVNQNLVFNVIYEDFTAWETAVADSYFTYDLNTVNQGTFAWTETGTFVGSQGFYMEYVIPAGTFIAGDTIDAYGGQLTGTEAAPLTTVLGAGGPILMEDPPVLSDPYPITGAVVLYNGDGAGTYTPILGGDGIPVDAYFYNTTGAFVTESGLTVGGLYTLDLDGLDSTNAFGIEVVAGPFTGYGNMGYANVSNTALAVGGSMVNVTCGIPVDVNITLPDPLVFSATAGIPFAVNYEFLDIDGVRAQGYYTHIDGQMEWWSSDPLFVPPAPVTFDGVTTTQGFYADTLTLWTAPSQWINVTEGGALELNPYLTPWGAISTQIGGVATDMFIKDWDNITLNILVGGFDWLLVANGWNLVSAPQDPVLKGLIPVFDAADALQTCQDAIITAFGAPDPSLQMADRIGPATYDMCTLATAEAAAFAIDSVHGYWIYAETDITVRFSALNYTAVGANVLNAVAGWNVVGFTHNYTVWTTVPMASHFTDGTFGPLAGATNTKIDCTMWDYTLQHYYSYVVDGWFVMPSRDWAWDFSYSSLPGNGFFLYLDAAAVVTFDVNY